MSLIHSLPSRSAQPRAAANRLLLTLLIVLAATATVLVAAPPQSARAADDVVEIFSRSNRADLVSGGDVLLEVTLPAGATVDQMVVTTGGRDVTDEFAVKGDGRIMGLVDGLPLGASRVTVTLPDGSGAHLQVTNHPIGGPVFSGPQILPWYCLEGAEDEQCNRTTGISYQYMSAATGQFAAYNPESPAPDVATITTDEGQEVPYIVRVEQGNLNRSRYAIAILDDPAEPWTRETGPRGWNGKLYVTHGAGCAMGHSEGNAPGVMDDNALARGYAVISHALADNTENCNNVVQAESMMMVKEHLIETYGDVRFMVGVGCSGGSIAQLHMANAYPGLYDGLILSCTYPDIPSLDLIDCPALLRYFTDPSQWAPGVLWTEPHMAAATTQQSFSVCISWLETFSPIFNPSVGTNCDVPQTEPERMYDPETNPDGVRCTYQDYLINLYGERAEDRWGEVEQALGHGFAGRPYGNVGLQYGLRGLLSGELTSAQFVDLNTKVGSVGIDYDDSPDRVSADPSALNTAYRAGVINQAHNLSQVVMIDMPVPADRYEFHDNYKSWDLRQRLINANGHADNHLIWYGPDSQGVGYAQADQPLDMVDTWLTAVESDKRDVRLADKIVANRPAEARDRCDAPDQQTCNLVFGSAGNIRYGAGKPDLANDVADCELKPHIRNEYAPIQFTDAQWEALDAAFPDGVCDWTKPGKGQQPAVPWQTYADGPGGRALGPAPVSVPFGPEGFTITRVAAGERTGTAVQISGRDRETSDQVIIASQSSAVDALAASPLAAHLDAPLLLTATSSLSATTAAEIQRLAATSAHIVGGEAVVGPQVASDLEALGLEVQRHGGADRVETAARVAHEMSPAGPAEVVIAPADSFGEGLAAAAYAAVVGAPLLFATPSALPEASVEVMALTTRATLIGDETLLGADVAAAVAALAASTTRISGTDVHSTATLVADQAISRGASPAVTWLATSADFADALVAGAAAARDRGVLLLVHPSDLDASPATREWLATADGIAQVRIAGGPAAVSSEVEAQVEVALAG